jgi:hypothetical protein
MARKRESETEAPRPAPITAAASRGTVELGPGEGLAYTLHTVRGLLERLTALEAVSDEAALLVAVDLLERDVAPDLVSLVRDRLAVVRRGRADAAGVEQEVSRGLLWSGERELLTPLSVTEHEAARGAAVAAAQRWLDAVVAEKARATAAKAEIGELEALHRAAQRVAHTGEDYRTQQVEMVVQGARVVTRRLDTGAVLEERDATASEIERAFQVRLWGER